MEVLLIPNELFVVFVTLKVNTDIPQPWYFKETLASGLLWLYADWVEYPTLYQYDFSETSESTQYHRLELDSPEAGTLRTLYVGVYGNPYIPNVNGSAVSYKIVAWSPPY